MASSSGARSGWSQCKRRTATTRLPTPPKPAYASQRSDRRVLAPEIVLDCPRCAASGISSRMVATPGVNRPSSNSPMRAGHFESPPPRNTEAIAVYEAVCSPLLGGRGSCPRRPPRQPVHRLLGEWRVLWPSLTARQGLALLLTPSNDHPARLAA